MPTKDEKKTDAVNPTVSPNALIVELEGALTGGRRTLFDTLKKLLKKEKLNLDEVTFIRRGIGLAPLDAIPELIEALEGDGVSTDKMQAALLEALKSGEAALALAPVLRKLIEAARKQNIPVVAVSCLPAEVAEALLQKSGLEELGVKLHVVKSAAACCPGKKDWQEVCRILTRIPRHCFALVSTGTACHTALSVDLRVIAVADEFTVAQDFGGAEAVYDTAADFDLDDLFARMPAA
jgi:beta-phosphoglucomutase-like phosphatase (HAD superfamily)